MISLTTASVYMIVNVQERLGKSMIYDKTIRKIVAFFELSVKG